jgi:peptidoglycan-associated lipoprotein
MASKCIRRNQEVIDDDLPDVQPVEQELIVASIDPAWGSEGQAMKARVFGSGFQDGARVRFGEDVEASRVVYDGDYRLEVTVPPLPVGSYDVLVLTPDGELSRLRGGLTIQPAETARLSCERATLYFDFDSSQLRSEAGGALDGLVDCLLGADGEIVLEGHCDERGTTEYNLALGQRRAGAVKDALLSRGVAPSRVEIMSFGEEQPADPGHDEAAWAANRRVELSLER